MILFVLLDLANTSIQFNILNQVWSKKQNVTGTEKNILIGLVFFSPFSLFSTSVPNMGAFKDFLTYMSIQLYVNNHEDQMLIQAIVSGLCLYIDPSSFSFFLGVLLCSEKAINPLAVFIPIATIFQQTLFFGNLSEQIRNIKNILTLKDHSENLGMYWYISIEVFKDRVDFFIIAYVLVIVIMLLQIKLITEKARSIIEITSRHDPKKFQSRIDRLRNNTLFLLVFVKVVLNQYPLLCDL